MFQIKQYRLPHDGIIPGARGHKKIVVPRGEKVWCIVYGTKIFWCAYLNDGTAKGVAESLRKTVAGETKHQIPLPTLLEWNFRNAIPTRIHREGVKT